MTMPGAPEALAADTSAAGARGPGCPRSDSSLFVPAFSISFYLRPQREPVDLQAKGELLACVVPGADVHRVKLQRHRPRFDVIQKPSECTEIASRFHAPI